MGEVLKLHCSTIVAVSQAKNRSITEHRISLTVVKFLDLSKSRSSSPPSSDALCFVLLLNVPVHSYGHVETVSSNFVGLLLDTEMNDTLSPAIKHRP